MSPEHDEALTMIHTQVVGEDGESVNKGIDPNSSWGPDRGTAIGRYIVLDKIGAGGMSAIYAAYDPELDRKVAIKLLHPQADGSQTTEGSSTSRTRLLREAQAMAKLSHPNVVRIFDVGTWEGEVFIAMEVIDGWSMSEWLREQPRTWQSVLNILNQAGKGLAAAHKAGLVHRDFKPDNLLISRETGRVYVVDFGLVHPDQRADNWSSAANDLSLSTETRPPSQEIYSSHDTLQTTELTQMGTIMGTPPYMAPEQHRGERTEGRTDQFSFCVTLYEALYGKRPFRGKTLSELRSQVLSGRIKFPDNRKVPTWLQKIIKRGLSVEISQRYPSMQELLVDLSKDPVTRRRKIFFSGLVVSSIVGSSILYPQLRGEQIIPCQSSAEEMNPVWNSAARQAVQDAFNSSKLEFASTAWQSVESHLDSYTENWVAIHKDVCEATEIRGEQSHELRDRRSRCLQTVREDLRSLIDEFTTADSHIVANAVSAVNDLPLLSACSDTQALSLVLALPDDEETLSELKTLWPEISYLRTLTRTQQFDRLLEVAEEAVVEASYLEYPPTIADAYLALGRAQEHFGMLEEATRSFNESLWAAESSHYDRVAALAAIHLINTKGASMGNGPSLNHLVQQAEATVERYGVDQDLYSRLLQAKLDLAISRGRLFIADQLAPEISELDSALAETDDLASAHAMLKLANAAREGHEFEEAEKIYDITLKRVQSILGDNHPAISAILTAWGKLQIETGQIQSAIASFQQAIHVHDNVAGPRAINPMMADTALFLAEALWKSGKNRTQSHAHALRAKRILESMPRPDPRKVYAVRSWILDHPSL